MRIYRYFILLAILTTLASCSQEPPLLQEKTVFGNQGWIYGKNLEYHPEIIDNSSAYIITLKLEFTEDYPHNFIKIQFDKQSTDGESYVKIFTIPIKDKNGVFIEKPIDGIYYVNTILSRQIYFSSPGKYDITIEELMPNYYLKGIKSAEFIIEKRIK